MVSMRQAALAASALCAITFTTSAHASDALGVASAAAKAVEAGDTIFNALSSHNFEVAPTVSTLGAGADVSWRPVDNWGLRLSGTYLPLSDTREIDGVDYDVDVTALTAGILADWYLSSNSGWRLTGGIRYNGTSADLTATPTGSQKIGGTVYAASDIGRLEGEVDFPAVAPYLGFGYEGALSDSWSIGFDAGVLYTGKADVDVRATGPLASNAAFSADLQREVDDIEDQMHKYGQFYPVVGVKLSYSF